MKEKINVVALTAAHLDDIVVVHLRAFPGFFLSSLGPRFLREFYAAFLVDKGAVALVAENEHGLVCGAVVGSTSPAGFFRRLLMRRWWAFLYASMDTVLRNPAVSARLIRAVWYRGEAPGDQDRALLSSIAVDPAKQGAGIGKQLIKEWLAEVRKRGCLGSYLTTDATHNDATNAFYCINGWKLESCYETREGRKMNRYVFDW